METAYTDAARRTNTRRRLGWRKPSIDARCLHPRLERHHRGWHHFQRHRHRHLHHSDCLGHVAGRRQDYNLGGRRTYKEHDIIGAYIMTRMPEHTFIRTSKLISIALSCVTGKTVISREDCRLIPVVIKKGAQQRLCLHNCRIHHFSVFLVTMNVVCIRGVFHFAAPVGRHTREFIRTIALTGSPPA
jgi:hypothetical protein